MADTQQRLPAGPPGEGRGPRLWLWFLVAIVIAFYWSAYSEQTAQLIDEEVRALIRDCEQRVRGLLARHRTQLDALAAALRERESLSADEVAALLDGNPAAAPQAAERSTR